MNNQPALHGQYGALLAFKPALEDKLDDDLLDVDEELRAEHLIRLAITHSPRPGILCLSADPPEAHLHAFAASRGKELYHLPLARISERNLRRIQRFHLLSRRSVREIADDYI